MKKTLLFFALLCAFAQGAWAQANWDEVYALTQTTSSNWTAINSGSTTGHTLGSTGNTTYYYANSNLSFTNSTAGGSGLTILGTVYLYVPSGKTITCTGANANEQTGAGAGIELASGNTLFLLGQGTVNATGGNAANGGHGGHGAHSIFDYGDYCLPGSGADGGNGGGGAGAGIGTRGGNGGNGGSVANAIHDEDEGTNLGVDGHAGSAGTTAGAMGNLYKFQSSVTLNATGGSKGTGQNGGTRGNNAAEDPYNQYNASGGGGGGAGGFGGAASNIGTGGPGGGGGGGGAAGNSTWRANSTNGFYRVGAGGGNGGYNGDGSQAANGETSVLTNPYNAEYKEGLSGNYNDSGWESGNGMHSGGSGGARGNASTSSSAVNLVLWPTSGAGTAENPYLINNANDWNTFAANVSGGISYSGKFIKLTSNISVTTMAGKFQNEDNYQPFSGTFDGDGHTLTLNVSNQSRFAAPFKCVNDATINNLRTAGTIDGTGNADGKLLGGLVGISLGNDTISGCVSSVTLRTDFSNDAAMAGLVAATRGGSLIINGCVFNGSLQGGANSGRCAGISGYEYIPTSTIISNTLFAPTSITVPTDDGYTMTFTRDADALITKCYYMQTLGTAQGTQATSSTTAPDFLGALVYDYSLLKVYAGALLFNGNYYYDPDGITNESTTLTTGTYTVYADQTITNRIIIQGDVVLDLGEGATLYARKGIELSQGNSLTINGPGALTINNCDDSQAGIGASKVGTLTINGGIINVRGGSNGAGIGGNAYNDVGGTITINGGIVNANGGYGGAGIGGGLCGGTYGNGNGTGICGNVYIYGGQVTAVGGSMAAGIGPGVFASIICMYYPFGGNLTIGWTNPEDFLYNSGFYSENGNYNRGLNSLSFVEGKEFIIEGLGEIANPSLPTNFGGRKIFPLVDQATALPGAGSLDDPYRISNLSDWMKLAVNVNSGTENYSGKYVRLENDLSVSIMVGNSEGNSFRGTFLGNNKTLTFSYNTWEENAAPFRFTNNATIKDLKVAGSISTSNKFAAGLASRTFGTTSITNCQVDTYIQSNVNGDGTHGGIVAMPSGTLNIEGCAFTGRLLTNKGTHSCGGFVGWHNDKAITITNSLYAPSGSIPSGWSAITGGSTFVRSGSPTITNCYYTETLGNAQGMLTFAYATDPGNLGDVVQAYSTLTAYTNGIFCDGMYYLKAATFSGEGNEGSPYLISNEFEWKSFAAYVNSGTNNYSGKYLKLTADISVTEMVGISEGNSFRGTFLGDSDHTLTFTQGMPETAFNEEYCAPFRYVNGANIRDLKVTGNIYTSQKFAAGLVSRPYGTTSITGCQVSTVIYSSVNDDGTHGGVVARPYGTLNIAGCVYTGHLLTNNGTTNCGGFVGWYNEKTINVTNSLYVPSGSIADGWSAITEGATFVRGGNPTINNSYYTEALGTEQCKLVYNTTTSVPTNLGTLKADYSMLKAYTNGILFNGTYYVTRALNGDGTVGSPYIIATGDDWETFIYNVNNGYNNYNGEFVSLDADINISQTIGLRDNRPFSGTFLGNGNTITANIISTTTGEGANEQGVAPFHYINNATINNLTVTGSIASASYHTSGIVGFANGTNTIEGCVVTATLNISSNYAGGIIGHGQSSNTTIRGCVFAGTINGVDDDRENIGGIWGWSTAGTPTLQNCLEVGTYIDIASMHPMGLQNNKGTITNCYYMNPEEGEPSNACTVNGSKQAYTFATTPANLGDAGTDYGMVKAYANGILFDGTYYVPSTGNISRTVVGYGDETGKWAFIASPVNSKKKPTTVTHLIGTQIQTEPPLYDYDLFRLNSGNNQWENYLQHTSDFNIVNGQGYLYATKETKTLVFHGTFNMENEEKTVGLSEGFNLVGNPFVVDAYANRSYYRMNAEGTDIEVVENYAANAIPVCTGVVVRATGQYESITFSTEAPQQQSANNGNLQMTLTKAGVRSDAFQDKAIVSFNEGSELEKFIFNENHAKLYIPQYGEDYAIAFSEMTGEVPLNFKTKETGRYTIGFNFGNVKGVRIQIIDKLEDRIIDLKAIDSYTFMGSAVDRSDRFTLVFTQVETDGVFAYQSGDDIIVSGEGELQVFDVMGRMVMTQYINGVETVEKPEQTGVYILRLNGMSQKIVVR